MKRLTKTFIRQIEKENVEMLRQIEGILRMKTATGIRLQYIYDLIDARVRKMKEMGF